MGLGIETVSSWILVRFITLSHAVASLVFCFVFVFLLFRAIPTAYGGSQARALIGTTAAGVHHSHSDARSEPYLQPTPQLRAMPDA